MHSLAHSVLGRSLALSIILSMLSAGCTPGFLEASPGLPQYQAIALIPLPGGVYNAVGANLMIERRDLSIDTMLGEQVFGAVWNSANGVWHWSHDVRYDGATFVDPTGAVHDVTAVTNGSAIPGTHWVKLDATSIKTKGGFAYHFDAQARIAHVSWVSDPYPRIDYVWGAGSLALRQCPSASTPIGSCLALMAIQLGTSGPTEVVDERSAASGVTRRAAYTYDGFGRLETARTAYEVDQALPGTLYEYGTWSSLISAQTSSEGERIEYDWEAGRRLSRVTQIGEGNPVHRFSYEYFLAPTAPIYNVTHVNPAGGKTVYRLDGQRRLLLQYLVDPSDSRHFAWHEGMLRPSQVIDLDGTVQRFPEWLDDDPVRIIEPSGNEIVLDYEPGAVDFGKPLQRPVAQISDSIGMVSTTTYDAQGRPENVINGEGEVTALDYQGLILASETSAWGATALFNNYGVHGHWVDAESSALPEVPVRRKFDVVGNPTLEAAGLQRGGTLERSYNGDRWLDSISVAPSDDAGGVGPTAGVAVERRSDGQIEAYRRPAGGDHEFEYDALGRERAVREKVDGAWRETTHAYNALGLVTEISRPNGMREQFDYDVYGRLTERRAFRGAALEGELTFAWNRGRIVQTFDSVRGQTRVLAYDGAGRIQSILYSGFGESLSYAYDLRSRITGESYTLPGPVVLELTREWDLADRELRLSRADGTPQGELLLERTYVDGRLTSTTYGNGLVRATLYDAQTLAPVGFEMRDSGEQLVETTSLSRAVKAGPTRLEFVNETTSPLAHTKEEYWLNRPGNLALPEGRIGARVFRWRGWADGVLEDERFYAWDELGNPASDSDGDTFTYNGERNRLVSVAGPSPRAYTWDAAGFPESRDGVPLAWSATGLLERVGPPSAPLVSISWDMADRPVSITVAGMTREFGLFGGMVEYDTESGALGWLHLEQVSLPFVGSERLFRHADFRGNTALVSDETAAIVAHKRYQPFGLDTHYLAAGYTEGHPTGFTGGLELVGTGLVWIGARILDSDVGRFLSPDPLLQPFQQYTYALGNPVWFRDPDGRDFEADAEFAADTAVGVGSVITLYGIVTGNAPVAALGAALIAYGTLVYILLGLNRISAAALRPDGMSGTGSAGRFEGIRAVAAVGTGLEIAGGLSGVQGVSCSPAAGHATGPRNSILLLLLMQIITALAVTRDRRGVRGEPAVSDCLVTSVKMVE